MGSTLADKWEGLIEAVANDVDLPRDRRAAAIAALRGRQQPPDPFQQTPNPI